MKLEIVALVKSLIVMEKLLTMIAKLVDDGEVDDDDDEEDSRR